MHTETLGDLRYPKTKRDVAPKPSAFFRVENYLMSKSLQGNCLLASPFMDDPNFFRSVIYLVRHTEDHAFGLILNRPTDFRMDKVVSMVCELECVHDRPLYCGGPVDGPLIALHDQPDLGSEDCIDGLHMTSDQDKLLRLFVLPEAKLKLFDGFAGWGAGQLEDEIATGSWLIADVDAISCSVTIRKCGRLC